MTCNGIAGSNMGVHLSGHNPQIHSRNDNEDQTDGAFLTSADGSQNDYAANRSEEFNKATDKKPGGIFT